MIILTAEQMRNVDRVTIDSGVSGITLMRNAGKAVYDAVISRDDFDRDTPVLVIAGKGNNGGDGFRVAQLLLRDGCNVSVFLLGQMSSLKGDAAISLQDAVNDGVAVTEITGSDFPDALAEAIESSGLIIDALFGTGLKGEVTGLAAEIIDTVVESGLPVISVDIPSGVNATTGEASNHCIVADETITFGALKVGHVFHPGRMLSGEVGVDSIGFTDEQVRSSGVFGEMIDGAEASVMIPARSPRSHKGSCGRVYVLAGSLGMTGAAALASMSALKTGAGLVTLGCPESLNDILEVKLTEVMTVPLPEIRKKRCLALRALGTIRDHVKNVDVVAIGPGLGSYFETRQLVRRLVSTHTGRIVLDADGITAFKGKPELLKDSTADIVLTPHPGELATLMSQTIDSIMKNPVEAAKKAAEITGCIVLLKGAPAIIVGEAETVHINGTGNEGMATAGMGDVLTGVIAGLAAQGLSLYDSAVLGAYLHGFAGDLGKESQGIHGLVAGDLIECIPHAIQNNL